MAVEVPRGPDGVVLTLGDVRTRVLDRLLTRSPSVRLQDLRAAPVGGGDPARQPAEGRSQRPDRRGREQGTGTRIELGSWTMSYLRAEEADHGRPYGGRIGGELGCQRPRGTPRYGSPGPHAD